ncbi:MAG: 2'-5' RNA ligase family protein [Anaerolineales bacterium]|nr:2'-5' RNA ligase family protein [Anaerolineales bacterium]
MEGLVSRLDPQHDDQLNGLVAELAQVFNLARQHLPPFPHFSYQIAPRYDRAGLPEALAQVARRHAPLSVRTSGLGLFPGDDPVLYLPLVRTAALSALHADLWATLAPFAVEPPPLYAPDQWTPHLTLISGGLSAAGLGEAVQRLLPRGLYWNIAISALSFIADSGAAQFIEHTFALGA